MNEIDSSGDHVLLLILPTKQQIFALCVVALTRAQASRRELTDGYRDALLLHQDGSLRRFEHIHVHGPWGETIGRKLLSRLTDAWSVSVKLSPPLTWSLEEIKQLLAKCIIANGSVLGPDANDGPSREALAMAIMAATSLQEIFDILDLPSHEGALDVL